MRRRRRGRTAILKLLPGSALVVALAACEDGSTPDPVSPPVSPSVGMKTAGSAGPIFRDVTDEVGLAFTHFTGATGEYYFPEIMGAGVAVLDYDGDGDLDVYLLQGGTVIPGDAVEDPPITNRLFRNDLVVTPVGDRTLRFTDVTAEAGVGDAGYSMGCAVGDYDNDGDADLYVTNFGPNVLYRNEGDGTFTDVTAESGADDPRWSTSAAFADFDNDGALDLVVVNYVAFADDVQRACRRPAGDRDYCTPLAYRPLPDTLFRNVSGPADGQTGGVRFDDVTEAAGLDAAFGNGLGVICVDFDEDGLTDIYVANDGVANQLWKNQGGMRFAESALLSGVAVNDAGDAEAGMGVTVADFDRDGDQDIFVVHLHGETNTLYVNQGGGVFDDRTFRHALGAPSRSMTGFGAELFDYDGDGVYDIMVVNGAVAKVDTQLDDPYPYMMPNQLFRGVADDARRFVDVTTEAGPGFGQAWGQAESSRGLAIGDLDLDGDIDVVVTNNNGPARVLLNEVGARNHWLRVTVEGTRTNRDGVGAIVGLEPEGADPRFERVHTDGSYCSARDRSVHFGLGSGGGEEPGPVSLVVQWPGGTRERWTGITVDTAVTLREGEGEPVR